MPEQLCAGCAAEATWEGTALTVRHDAGCLEALAMLAPVGGDE